MNPKEKPTVPQVSLTMESISKVVRAVDSLQELVGLTVPAPESIKQKRVPINRQRVSPCVDERPEVVRLLPDSQGKITINGVSLNPVTEISVPDAIPATPFPGGRIGFYQAEAYAFLASQEPKELQDKYDDKGKKFVKAFIQHIAALSEERFGQNNPPVHIEFHPHENDDAQLFDEEKNLDINTLQDIAEKGLGCGFGGVWFKVLVQQLLITDKQDMAITLLNKLGGQIENGQIILPDEIAKYAAQTLNHTAIKHGAQVAVLEGTHAAKAIVFTDGYTTLDKQSLAEQNQMHFVTTLLSPHHDPDNFSDSVLTQIFTDRSQLLTWHASVNLLTYMNLGGAELPRYYLTSN